MGGRCSSKRAPTGLDPAVVVEFIRQAISLLGNASFCGLSDRRKSLLAKMSPESFHLLDEINLFEKNSADNLFGRSSHGNRKQFFSSASREMPGLFPRYQCPTRNCSMVQKSPKPRLTASKNAVQEFRAS